MIEADSYNIKLPNNLIRPESLPPSSNKTTIGILQGYFDWLPKIANNLAFPPTISRLEFRHGMNLQNNGDQTQPSMLHLLAPAYQVVAGIISGDIAAVPSLGDSEQRLRDEVGLGLAKVLEIIQFMGTNSIKWHPIKIKQLRNGELKYNCRSFRKFEQADFGFIPSIGDTSIQWMENTAKIDAENFPTMLIAEIWIGNRHFLSGPTDLKMGFSVKKYSRYNNAFRLRIMDTSKEQMVDSLLGINTHKAAIATGDYQDCARLQKSFVRFLNVGDIYRLPQRIGGLNSSSLTHPLSEQ